ncbi:PREDICTED: germinal center-associated signaling and motility protein [Condylura cristata]|uniref:germinal center-associated signaling and motility protein n=1 Tax=Condylura cristata TaxID=143302 RepID=UPI00033472F2|nr:PREDICTED: germinal center-associated signaling and motility protein [Condylura cristata]
MGNSLLRKNSFKCQQTTQEVIWNLGKQDSTGYPSGSKSNIRFPILFQEKWNLRFLCWDCHMAEGCVCLPWKKLHLFKTRQNSQKENEGLSFSPTQGNADQSSTEDLCYTVIHHSVPRRRPSRNSAEEFYENISPRPEKPRVLSEATETEYSILRVTCPPRHVPSAEEEYELHMPDQIFSYSPRHSHVRMPSSETQLSHL